jgi:hypothetical protein
MLQLPGTLEALASGWILSHADDLKEHSPLAPVKRLPHMLKPVILALAAILPLSSSVARAAEPSPRVVLLDALVLPAALEQTNLRSKAESAVSEAARAHGWEPVSIATDCRDLGCAGAVAHAAKSLYVLVLVGRFAANDTYASDVGVSLWRDGNVTASRTEADEDAERSKSSTGVVLRCGPPDGTCTPALLATKLEQYAVRLLDEESKAVKARSAVAAALPTVPPPPSPSPVLPGPPPDEGRSGRLVGWSLVGAGALLAGGAITLWALNGSKVHCTAVSGDADACRFERRTTTAALVTGGAAVAALAGGIIVLAVDRGSARVALGVHPSGVTLGGTF